MGRSLKPSNVLELSGAFRKNPSRKRARAAEPRIKASLGEPPAEWVEGALHNARCAGLLRAWNEIVDQDPGHVLNIAHRTLVEISAELKYKIRRASMGYGKATSGDYAQLASNLAKMGMTPVDSPRVAASVTLPGQGAAPSSSQWGEYVS